MSNWRNNAQGVSASPLLSLFVAFLQVAYIALIREGAPNGRRASGALAAVMRSAVLAWWSAKDRGEGGREGGREGH